MVNSYFGVLQFKEIMTNFEVLMISISSETERNILQIKSDDINCKENQPKLGQLLVE